MRLTKAIIGCTLASFMLLYFIACDSLNHPTVKGAPIQIAGNIKNYKGKVTICKITGGVRIPLEIFSTDSLGNFTYSIPEDFKEGVYIIYWDESGEKKVRIILDKENISFTATNHLLPDIEYINSPLNAAFYEYLNMRNDLIIKLDILGKTLEFYPEADPLYKDIRARFIELQNEYQKRSENIINKFKGTFLSTYVESDKLPKLFQVPEVKDQKKQWFDDWLKSVDFRQSILLNSNFYGDKISQYIKLSQLAATTKEEGLFLLNNSIDSVLTRSMIEPEVYDYCVSFLLQILKEIPFKEFTNKVLVHYKEQKSCNNVQLNEEAEKLINIEPGKKAPDFNITGSKSLYNIDSRYVLLFFWASDCPNCKEIIPKLKELYDRKLAGDVAIVTVCVNEIQHSDLHPKWTECTVNDKKNTIKNYNILETPTMFLLDEDKNIISSPVNIYGVLQEMERLKL